MPSTPSGTRVLSYYELATHYLEVSSRLLRNYLEVVGPSYYLEVRVRAEYEDRL